MLADKIRAARAAAKMTQEQLADKTGLHPNTIKGFERGMTPSASSYAAILQVLPGIESIGDAAARATTIDDWIVVKLGPVEVRMRRVPEPDK